MFDVNKMVNVFLNNIKFNFPKILAYFADCTSIKCSPNFVFECIFKVLKIVDLAEGGIF